MVKWPVMATNIALILWPRERTIVSPEGLWVLSSVSGILWLIFLGSRVALVDVVCFAYTCFSFPSNTAILFTHTHCCFGLVSVCLKSTCEQVSRSRSCRCRIERRSGKCSDKCSTCDVACMRAHLLGTTQNWQLFKNRCTRGTPENQSTYSQWNAVSLH